MDTNSPVGRFVLVVEDDYFLAMDMKHNLQQAGVIVVGPVARVADALELISKGRIDAAVLDIELSAETSYPIADRLMAMRIPFVFVSNATIIPHQYRGRCLDKMADVQLIMSRLFPPSG